MTSKLYGLDDISDVLVFSKVSFIFYVQPLLSASYLRVYHARSHFCRNQMWLLQSLRWLDAGSPILWSFFYTQNANSEHTIVYSCHLILPPCVPKHPSMMWVAGIAECTTADPPLSLVKLFRNSSSGGIAVQPDVVALCVGVVVARMMQSAGLTTPYMRFTVHYSKQP